MKFTTFLERFNNKRTFSPEGEGGTGGGGDTGAGDSGGQGQSFDPVRDFGIKQETKTEDDEGFDILLDSVKVAQTETQKAEALRESAQQVTPEKQKEIVAGMHSQLQTAIGNVKLPDDMFGADFDPSDGGQIREVIAKSVKFAIQQAVGMAMFPTSQAMQQNNTALIAQVKAMMNENLGNNNESVKLQSDFPLLADPSAGPLFRDMNERMVKAGKKYPERLKALRGFAQRLELNVDGARDDSSGGGLLTGAAALDNLFGA